jgi:PKD repeat protein
MAEAGVEIIFDGSGSYDPDGTIVLYDWDFGDGNAGSGMVVTHTYAYAGSYIVTLCVTDNDGNVSCCETFAMVLAVPPVCDANGPYSGSTTSPVVFDGSGSYDPDGTIVGYAWDFGDGNTGSGVAPTHTYAAGGTYVVTLYVTDNDGYESICATVADIVEGSPVCDAGGEYMAEAGVEIIFDGSGSYDPNGTIELYDWDFGDGNTGSGMIVTHTYAYSGAYMVTLCVTDNDGNVSCCETLVMVLAVVPVCDAGGPYTGCVNGPVVFDGSGSYDPDGTLVSHVWDFGDGNTGSGIAPTHAYAAAGTYVVTLCVMDNEGYESCCEALVNIDGASGVESTPWGKIKSLFDD